MSMHWLMGLYSGAVVFNKDGSFSCFFGANRVEMDLEND